jgi:hypothetical protein
MNRPDQMDLDDGPDSAAGAVNGTAANTNARFAPPAHSFEAARPVNAHRAPPSDADAEENLIAALFVDATEVLDKCADASITESSFTQPRLAAVFGSALDLHAQKEPVGIATLAHVLKNTRRLRASQ